MHAVVGLLLSINQHVKFEVPSFTDSKDVIGRQHVNKKLSYRRGTARRAMSVESLSTVTQLYEESHLKGLR